MNAGCAGKTVWDPLTTRAIHERHSGVFTTRRYTNPRLPVLLSNQCFSDSRLFCTCRLHWPLQSSVSGHSFSHITLRNSLISQTLSIADRWYMGHHFRIACASGFFNSSTTVNCLFASYKQAIPSASRGLAMVVVLKACQTEGDIKAHDRSSPSLSSSITIRSVRGWCFIIYPVRPCPADPLSYYTIGISCTSVCGVTRKPALSNFQS